MAEEIQGMIDYGYTFERLASTYTELDSYQCRHGLGYTVFESSKNGIRASQEVFVPLHDNCELTRVTLTNTSAKSHR